MERITRRLATFLSDLKFEDLPPEVVDQAKKCLLDFTGVAIAGTRAILEISEGLRRHR
jgi:2-methylcitrate dehydratase PrpD